MITQEKLKQMFDYEDGQLIRKHASNRKIFSNNKSRLKGVCWHKRIQKWGVSCSVNGKQKHYGYFGDLLSAASRAFVVRTQLHGQFANHF